MLNKVILQGRLTKDVDLRQTQSGGWVARFSIATDGNYTNKQTGERDTTFTECVAFNHTADHTAKYFQKGQEIIVEGELRNNNYTDKNGVNHYGMQVYVSSVYFCGSKQGAQSAQQAYQQNQYQQPPQQTYQPQAQHNQVPSAETVQAMMNGAQQAGIPAGLEDLGGFEEIISDGDVPF